jgi:hypothetical protein
MSHIQSSTFLPEHTHTHLHKKSWNKYKKCWWHIKMFHDLSKACLLQRGIITAGIEQGKCSPKNAPDSSFRIDSRLPCVRIANTHAQSEKRKKRIQCKKSHPQPCTRSACCPSFPYSKIVIINVIQRAFQKRIKHIIYWNHKDICHNGK